MTAKGTWEMKVILIPYAGQNYTANYNRFKVGRAPGYVLFVAHYNMTTSNFENDVFKHHNGRSFSTPDLDQDASSLNCAQQNGAGWWFDDCHYINLNGLNTGNNGYKTKGIIAWVGEKGKAVMFKETEMKIRRTA